MLQAPMFTCSTDDRSSLRLIVDGQTENDPATENRKYIQEAKTIIFEYIRLHLSEWHDVHYLAPIYFDAANANKELSDYYKSLKSAWLTNMRSLNLVSVDTEAGLCKKTPSEIYVLDAALSGAIKADDSLLQPIYNVMTKMHKDQVPTSSQLVYWSDVFVKWYEGDTCSQIVTIGNIVDYIAANGMAVVSEADLLEICEYLRDSEQLSFFDKNILLTEDETLTNKTEGYKCADFIPRLKSCVKVLLPEHASKFVKAGFADLIKLPSFENKDIKEALSSSTEALQTNIKTITDAAKVEWEKDKSVFANTTSLLSIEQRIDGLLQNGNTANQCCIPGKCSPTRG